MCVYLNKVVVDWQNKASIEGYHNLEDFAFKSAK